MLKISDLVFIDEKFLEKSEKKVRGNEKCCTFAPAELKEGLPLK